MGKLLGIDYGDTRIGIATTDENQEYIFPNKTIENSANVYDKIINIINEEDIDKVVVGFPVNMKGEENAQSDKIKHFVEELEEKLSISVELEDERLTSQLAERLLVDVPGSKKQKGNIDRQAAVLILESYIGRNRK